MDMSNKNFLQRLRSNASDRIDPVSPSSHSQNVSDNGYERYQPPSSPISSRQSESKTLTNCRSDPIDMLVAKDDDDKYRTPMLQETLEDGSDLSESASDMYSERNSDTHSDIRSDMHSNLGSEYREANSTQTMSTDGENYARARAQEISELYQMIEDDGLHKTRQKFAYLSIVTSAIQVLVLALMLSLCGVAPLDVNPFIGSYPDTLSEWGGKNPTLLKNGEWWRIVSPACLNVGIVQLVVNTGVQLETCALFERQWGSTRYMWIYLISVIGSQIVSCSANPDTVGVGSSAALMGLFGAKLAEVVTQVCFDMNRSGEDSIHLDQLCSVMCSLSLVMALSFFTYIDWSAHMGGLATGFIVGIVSFARPIRNRLSRTLWRLFGIILLFSGLPLAFYVFWELVEPDPELANTCDYFRNLYAEGYDCSCFVF